MPGLECGNAGSHWPNVARSTAPPNREVSRRPSRKGLMVMYRQELIERRIFKLPLNLKRIYISFSHIEKHMETTLRAAEDPLKRICKLPMMKFANQLPRRMPSP